MPKAKSKTNPNQSKEQRRIEELEFAIFEMYAYLVNLTHYRSRIEIAMRAMFTEKEFLVRSQSCGREPMFVSDILHTIANGMGARERGKQPKNKQEAMKRLDELRRIHEAGG